MVKTGILLLALAATALLAGQSQSDKTAAVQPQTPVIDTGACPFEGCTFGKWLVVRNTTIFTTWNPDRKAVATLQNGEVVTGLTGVHITWKPDRIQVLKPIPGLQLQPGDLILRYMSRGEGFYDLWAKGQWDKQYDGSFISEKDGSGCLRDCAAKVISEGHKEWWVQLKTSQGATGWTKVDDQFACIDSLGGDPRCDKL